MKDGVLDRAALGLRVFGNKPALRRLEAIVHPMVQRRQRAFLRRAALRGARLVVLDIPLLFEGLGERRVDATLVVSAPAFLQHRRVMARSGMTTEKLAGILRQQVPDAVKRHKATVVIPTGLGLPRRRAPLSPRRWPTLRRRRGRCNGRPIPGARNSQPASHATVANSDANRLEGRMREIVLDTETTGLDPLTGHRIVEVGCIELENLVATGRSFQAYFNPEREMPHGGAMDVHGLTDAFLADKPLFAERAEEMLAFIGDAQLVIHNAQFDLGFLNAELERAGRTPLANAHIDTVSLARKKFPGQRASLDALCERFGVENSHRTKHGALLDAELLAEVYIELIGGRQRDLGLAPEIQNVVRLTVIALTVDNRARASAARPHMPSAPPNWPRTPSSSS